MATCDACGWAAAFCSMLAFGSFGVPIKSDAAVKVDIDPLVFQSYKSFMCFATSWLIVFFTPFEFTWWGCVSALFWVPGGTATVFAVKNAGLALGVGIGSSFIVLVSFIWGIFIFNEHVHSKVGACFAILCMMLGLAGMSYFSSPEEKADKSPITVDTGRCEERPAMNAKITYRRSISYQGLESADAEDSEDAFCNDDSVLKCSSRTIATAKTSFSEETDGILRIEDEEGFDSATLNTEEREPDRHVIICGKKIQRRTLGMLSAMFCGVWGGSIMVPMKWCKADTKGTHYLLSFSIGAMLVTLSLWAIRYTFQVIRCKSFIKAYDNLPSFHIEVMWFPGGLSGLLWSIGNFFSLISVFYLGQGVGYPLVQTSILVSGLWGIFYFKEITGLSRITKWLASSSLTIFGILLLSYEHHTQ